jgi:prevent-host-death family protein
MVAVSELKRSLSKYLAYLGTGESILITHRGEPVALLETADDFASRVRLLEQAGLVRPPTRKLSDEFFAAKAQKGRVVKS